MSTTCPCIFITVVDILLFVFCQEGSCTTKFKRVFVSLKAALAKRSLRIFENVIYMIKFPFTSVNAGFFDDSNENQSHTLSGYRLQYIPFSSQFDSCTVDIPLQFITQTGRAQPKNGRGKNEDP